MGVKQATPPESPNNNMQLRRRKMTVLKAGHFAGLSVGNVPKRPKIWCAGLSRNATQDRGATTCKLRGFWSAQENLKGAQACAKAGGKFFSRSLIDTAACERDVFDNVNTICFA